MTSLAVLELFASLAVQVTLLILVTAWITRRDRNASNMDSYWAALHVSILLVTAAAFLMPHLRLATWADLHPTSTYPAGPSLLQHLGTVCGWMWIVGALTLFVIGTLGMVKAVVILWRAKPDDDLRKRLLACVPSLATDAKPIDIRLSEASVGAFCWQIHRPVIAVPEAIAEFPVAEQVAIIRHELAHLRCQHPLHLFLQRLVESIYWFHPLIWWASRQAAAAREIHCDRDAVSTRDDAAAYLRSILRMIEMETTGPSLLPAGLAFLGSASLLGLRAKLLADAFDRPAAPRRHWKTMFAFVALALGCALIWLPVNPRASRRADFSPWPTWTARSLDAVGIPVRDYEVDGHRLDGHEYLE